MRTSDSFEGKGEPETRTESTSNDRQRIVVLVLIGLLSVVSGSSWAATSGHSRWIGPHGQLLPFETERDLSEFLQTAQVVSRTTIREGITRPVKILLERDGIEMHAVFRVVDERRTRYRARSRVIRAFRDYHGFEVAAFVLSRMLAIDNVPVTVPRRLGGKWGSIQAWIESAKTEKSRRKEADAPTDHIRWIQQWQTMRTFDVLIDNFDRNLGNVLIDSRWQLWMIDHSRSFTIDHDLHKAESLYLCQRRVWERLLTVENREIRDRLAPYLERSRLEALLERRGLLTAHFRALIDERGESAVLFD